MNMKQFIKDYLNFTRKEKIAVVTLLVTLFTIYFLPTLTARKKEIKDLKSDTAWANNIRKLTPPGPDSATDPASDRKFWLDTQNETQYERKGEPAATPLFNFNPNTLSVAGWKQLGIPEKTTQTILNYLSRGGSFKKADDLQKIYGLKKQDYDRIAPYIRIEKTDEPDVEKDPIRTTDHRSNPSVVAVRSIDDLNTTDTTALIALPGIGSKLAARIIRFRDKAGGFYAVEQVKEIYGLQDTVFQKIKQFLHITTPVQKLNINTASMDELRNHPYFTYNVANAITQYRNQHGAFSNPADIKKIIAVTDEVYNKLAPYITIQ